jgi:hypothetical protein
MTSTITKSTTNSISTFSVFGTIQKEKINHFTPPYSVRNNCQLGQWTVGSDDILGNALDIAIFSMSSYFGNLGKTKGANWLQIWFVGMPNEEKLPKNTVCVTYLKGESLTNLGQKAITVMGKGVDPGHGVWTTKFEKRTGAYGNYYVLNFDWRERTKEEMKQLELIAEFAQSNPLLSDPNIPPTMVELSGDANIETAQELIKLIEASKEQN